MRYIVILLLTISSCQHQEVVEEIKHVDTVLIKKRCQGQVITEQMQRIDKLERKLIRIKKKLKNGKNKKRDN